MNAGFGSRGKDNKLYSVLVLSAFSLIWLCGLNAATAEDKSYPNKPIRIVIPYEPGGVIDLGIRVMTDDLTKELKVPMIIENKGGASGMLGSASILKASPDGYTVLAAGDTAMTTSVIQSPNPPYDPFKDFIPIGAYGGSHVAFGVLQSSSLKTIADFVREAKANPGKLTFGVTSLGGENHLQFELFKKIAAVNIKLVPFKGTGEAIAALLGKHIDAMALTYVGFLPYINAGDIRVIVMGASIPGISIPNFAEAGYPRVMLPRLNGFFVSAKTPAPICEKLGVAFKRVATNPEVIKKWDKIGLVPEYKTSAEFANLIREKYGVYSKLMIELGLKKK